MRRRASQTGLLIGAVGAPYTFQRTLVTRTSADQALVTGLSFLIHSSTASAIQESIQALALTAAGDVTNPKGLKRWSRYSILLDALVVAGGIGVQRALPERPNEPLRTAVGRTLGWMTATTAAAGALVGAGHELSNTTEATRRFGGMQATAVLAGAAAGVREYQRRQQEDLDRDSKELEPSQISAVRSLAMAGAVTAGSVVAGHAESLLVDRVSRGLSYILPGGESRWRPVGHLAVLGAVGWGGRVVAGRIARMIEGREKKTEPALDVPPLATEVSGGPGSLVDFETMSRMGRRFVWTIRRPDEIERVVGGPVEHPVRVYVGLDTEPTEEERVRLALDELERAGGLDKSWLMVASPTGTGYVNYAAAGALEFLSKGNCATLAMQYSQRPSPLSLDRVAEGRSQFSLLVERLSERLRRLPADARPKVVIFGESLGAWTSQDAFIDKGTDGLEAAGIDYAIWIGTPMRSRWKDQVLAGGVSVDPSMVGVFDRIEDLEALDPELRQRLHYVMITHTNDGVALFGPEILVKAPDWLGEPETRPRKIPKGQRWIPITSFVQTLIDTKNAARVIPGQFEAEGHDYRADIVPFFNLVLGFDQQPETVTRITEALEWEEQVRTNWIAEHGKVGRSMASVVLAEVRKANPDAFLDAVTTVRIREFSPTSKTETVSEPPV